jgi:hypothetical protein
LVLWFAGGRTDIADLVLLSDHHHTVVHLDGITLVFQGAELVAIYPDGLTLAA